MRKLIQNDRGETLVEVLASILIAVLSVTLLFSSVMVSSEMDKKAKEMDRGYYAGLTEADGQMGTPVNSTTVTVDVKRVDPADLTHILASVTSGNAPSINIYGDNGVYSYKRK